MSKDSGRRGPNTAQLRDAIDRGQTGSKVPFPDPASTPLGTDDEAAGVAPEPASVARSLERETANPAAHAPSGRDANAAAGVQDHPDSSIGVKLAIALCVLGAVALLAVLLLAYGD